MGVLPRPALSSSPLKSRKSGKSFLPTVFSLAVILILLRRPPQQSVPAPTLSQPSLFLAHESSALYARKREYESYQWGTTCSSAAKKHFWSRFNRSHYPLGIARLPKSVDESMNRMFLSAVPHEVGDGLGHRICILNYELHMAFTLGLTYSHRVSQYGSITKSDPLAVERLFGWSNNEITRDEVLEKGCAEVTYVNDTCEIPNPNIVCNRVRTRAKGGLFDQTVFIPDELAECFLQRGPQERELDNICYPLVQSFLAAYSEPNTLFQMHPNLCFHEYLYTNFSQTAGWLREKYWSGNFHTTTEGHNLLYKELRSTDNLSHSTKEILTSALVHNQQVNDPSTVVRIRDLSLEKQRIHIALHIRRGDFFNYTNRVLIPDWTYVDVVSRIKVALDEIMDENVPITVQVFSEGVPAANKRLKDNHDISSMDKIYVNEFGQSMPPDHWDKLMRASPRFNARYGVGRGFRRPDVTVKMNIATDTIRALHDMLASDFFVGSISGLSMQVVRNIGRGVKLLPVHESELVEDEFMVPFDYARNNIASFLNETMLYKKIAEYARKNRLACSVW